MSDKIRVTLAVGSHNGTWYEEDVFVPVQADVEGKLADAAEAAWIAEHPRKSVSFLTPISWEYPEDEDSEYTGSELNTAPGDVAARDSF